MAPNTPRPVIVGLVILALFLGVWLLRPSPAEGPTTSPKPHKDRTPVPVRSGDCPVCRSCDEKARYVKPLDLLEDTWNGISEAAEKYCDEAGCGDARGKGLAAMPNQVEFYYSLASSPTIKTVCEVGFNAGHSVAVWLQSNPEAYVYNFDLMEIAYQPGPIKYLRNKFGNRFELIPGDSTKSIPKWAAEHPEVKCDLISVDGGHSEYVAYEDLKNMAKLAHADTVVVIDDICRKCKGVAGGWVLGPTAAWDRIVKDKIMRPIKCYEEEDWHRGWCVARYLNAPVLA